METIDENLNILQVFTVDSRTISTLRTQNDKIKIWNIDSKKLQILEKADALYPQYMVTDFTTGIIYFADIIIIK